MRLFIWSALALLSLTSAWAETDPSESLGPDPDLDIRLHPHNESHAILHMNSSVTELHSDFLVPHDILHHIDLKMETENISHPLENGWGDDEGNHNSSDAQVNAAPVSESEISSPNTPDAKKVQPPNAASADSNPQSFPATPPSPEPPSAAAEATHTPAAEPPAPSSPAEPPITTVRLGTTPSAGDGTARGDARDPSSEETSSSEEDDGDDEDDDLFSPPPNVNFTIENREGGMDASEQAHMRKVTTFTVVMSAIVGSVFVVLVGMWIHRLRRQDNRALLDEDDEEFTVFNVVDHQYPARRTAQYAPLP